MDPNPPSRTPRKVRFRPTPPPPRTPRFTTPEIEEDGDEDKESQEALAAEHLSRRGERVEKKPSVQVTLSPGSASTSIRSFGKQSERTDDGSKRTNDEHIVAYSEASATSEMQDLVTSISATQTQVVTDCSVDLTDAAIVKKKKEYREPWDYDNSNYPITLPLRKPQSGDPEVLDKAEFEEAPVYNENSINPASDLGLQPQHQDEIPRMLIFQFPRKLPLGRLPTNANSGRTDGNFKAAEKSVKSVNWREKVMVGSVSNISGNSNVIKGKEIAGSSMDRTSGSPLKKDDSLKELPKGYMGKMSVYKSGAVKLKLGDIVFNVSPGLGFSSPQSVMAINTTDKICCEVGEVKKKAVVTPDMKYLLERERD